MALNSSGPISLAGATAGQSIALELGLSTTGTISLNQTNVRSLAGVPTGTIVMPLNFWGKSNQAYWIANSSITEASDWYDTCVDSSGNIYVMGDTTTGEDKGVVLKLNNLGSVQFSTQLVNTLLSTYGMACLSLTLLPNGNIATGGQFQVASARSDKYFTEINGSTGALISTGRNNQGSVTTTSTRGMLGLSDGSFISTGNTSVSSNTYPSIQKFSSPTASPTWGLRNSLSGGTYYRSAVASNGNIIAVGSSGGTPAKFSILSVTSSGTQVFLKISSTTTAHVFFDVVCIGTDAYAAGYVTNGTLIQCYVAKYDVSGNLVWGRTLSQSPNTPASCAMDKDSLGNIYISWNLTNSGAAPNRYATLIVKYNSSGVLQWQREFNRMSINQMLSVVNDSAFVLTCGTFSTLAVINDGLWFCQFPTDGSKTGTYTVNGKSVTYSASSWSETSYSVATTNGTTTAPGATTLGTAPTTTASLGASNIITNI